MTVDGTSLAPTPSPGADRAFLALRAVGLLALAYAFVWLGPAAELALALAVVGLVVRLSIIDIRTRTLPNRIVLPGAAFVLAAHGAIDPDRLVEFAVAAAATALVLLLASLPYRGALGMGDVKFGLLLGAAVGKGAVLAISVTFISASLFAVALFVVHGRRARGMTMPFGPFLALGTLAAILAAEPWHQVVS